MNLPPEVARDTAGNGFISALDALQVINEVARRSSAPSPEAVDSALDAWLDDELWIAAR